MSNQNANAHCSICGKPYHVCHTCEEQKTFKPWRIITDTIGHYKIYMAIHGYTTSKDKKKAKDELNNCDLSELKEFKPEVQKAIEEILAESKTTKPILKKQKINVNE